MNPNSKKAVALSIFASGVTNKGAFDLAFRKAFPDFPAERTTAIYWSDAGVYYNPERKRGGRAMVKPKLGFKVDLRAMAEPKFLSKPEPVIAEPELTPEPIAEVKPESDIAKIKRANKERLKAVSSKAKAKLKAVEEPVMAEFVMDEDFSPPAFLSRDELNALI
jgi:uncharacterized protein with von Willebrand factor type A (vWA) domain